MAEPESLAVIHQYLHRRGPPVAEHEHRAGKRVLLQRFFADPGQAVDPLAEIGGLYRPQDAHLRRNLDHGAAPKKTLLTAVTTSGLWQPGRWIRIFAPRGCSSSTMHSGDPRRSRGVNSRNVIAGFCAEFFAVDALRAGIVPPGPRPGRGVAQARGFQGLLQRVVVQPERPRGPAQSVRGGELYRRRPQPFGDPRTPLARSPPELESPPNHLKPCGLRARLSRSHQPFSKPSSVAADDTGGGKSLHARSPEGHVPMI